MLGTAALPLGPIYVIVHVVLSKQLPYNKKCLHLLGSPLSTTTKILMLSTSILRITYIPICAFPIWFRI